jgi:hypothetical protein
MYAVIYSYPKYMQLLCPTGKKSVVSSPDRSVKCATVFNVLCKRSRCTVELCPAWPMWNHMGQRPVPVHPRHHPPPQTGHLGFSLLAASKRNEPGWCTFTSGPIGNLHPQESVCAYCSLFLIP